MIRKIICISFFALLLQTSMINAGTTESEELKGSGSQNTADECFEGFSRAMFKFNMALDDIVIEPIAKGYNKLPSPVKKGTSNFTSNIGTLLSIPNNILQGNIKQLGHSVGSFAVNTTVGILVF